MGSDSPLYKLLNWNVGVGKLFGIPIRIHISILFFLFPVVARMGGPVGLVAEYMLLVVLSILFHELGHALTAKHFRLSDLLIMLHGFGGFARSEGVRRPREDLLIILAGPAATFLLGGVCLACVRLVPGTAILSPMAEDQLWLAERLGGFNILMGCLNLLPLWPLDGGQALRNLIGRRLGEFKALRAVCHISLLLGAGLFLWSLFSNQVFIGLFGAIGALGGVQVLLQSGGIKPGEYFQDRRDRKRDLALAEKKAAATRAYLDDVRSREKAREERDRLKKIFAVSGIADEEGPGES